MSRKELADAFNLLAEAAVKVAIELEASDQPASPPPAPVAAAADPVRSVAVDQTVCPKHGTPWTEGTYGPFCRSTTDDPAWGKQKPDGKMFCKITPKNAPDYLRVHGAAAA